mmetsp:Transcript_17943/g.57377  ORF Transcript_17943/g.57377 Transcript_17943/m.57377 type:complete len:211 (-) Transcript_17943:491-1123(-)
MLAGVRCASKGCSQWMPSLLRARPRAASVRLRLKASDHPTRGAPAVRWCCRSTRTSAPLYPAMSALRRRFRCACAATISSSTGATSCRTTFGPGLQRCSLRIARGSASAMCATALRRPWTSISCRPTFVNSARGGHTHELSAEAACSTFRRVCVHSLDHSKTTHRDGATEAEAGPHPRLVELKRLSLRVAATLTLWQPPRAVTQKDLLLW